MRVERQEFIWDVVAAVLYAPAQNQLEGTGSNAGPCSMLGGYSEQLKLPLLAQHGEDTMFLKYQILYKSD